jgi:hypothetical protein
MGRENNRFIIRDLVQLVDKNGTPIGEAVNHPTIMHNLMADIDRRAIFYQRAFNNLHSPINTRAKAAWLRQGQAHREQIFALIGHGISS